MKKIVLPEVLQPLEVAQSVFESEITLPPLVWRLLMQLKGQETNLKQAADFLELPFSECSDFLRQLKKEGFLISTLVEEIPCPIKPIGVMGEGTVGFDDFEISEKPLTNDNDFEVTTLDHDSKDKICVELEII